MAYYLLGFGTALAILLTAVYLFISHIIHSALSKYNIRLEKIRFLSLCNLSLNLPETGKRDPSTPIVHLTVGRIGLRFHRWRRPFGLTYVKPIEFYLKDITVKVFRPPTPRKPKTTAAGPADLAQSESNPRRKAPTPKNRSQRKGGNDDHDSTTASNPASPLHESILSGVFNISKNNFLVKFARNIVENVCLTITEAEVIIDDQVQIALGMAMLFSSVFDLSNPEEQQRQQQMRPTEPLTTHNSFGDADSANTLRYVTNLSLSDLDSALVPSKARKRRSIVSQFRGNGTITISADIAFDPRIRMQNLRWDTQLETLDLFLRPAIHALYKLRRPPGAGRSSVPPSQRPPLPDLSDLAHWPVTILRQLDHPHVQWFPRQLDIYATLRQLNIYFTFPSESKVYSSSSEAPTKERTNHSGALRFSLKSLNTVIQIPDIGARDIRSTVDLKFKLAAMTLLKPSSSGSEPRHQSRDRRLLGIQSFHLHLDGELVASPGHPLMSDPAAFSSAMANSFHDPGYNGYMRGDPAGPSSLGAGPTGAHPTFTYTSHLKTKLNITNPFVDLRLDDIGLWESFVRHVRQTRFSAAKAFMVPVLPPHVSSALQHRHSAQRPESPVFTHNGSPGLGPSGSPYRAPLSFGEVRPGSNDHQPFFSLTHPSVISPPGSFVIPTISLDIAVYNPAVKLWVPYGSEEHDSQPPGDGVESHLRSPVSPTARMADFRQHHSSTFVTGDRYWPTSVGREGYEGQHPSYRTRSPDALPLSGKPPRPANLRSTDYDHLLLALDTPEFHLTVRLHRKSTAKLKSPTHPGVSHMSATTPQDIILSTFGRLRLEPLSLRLGPQPPTPSAPAVTGATSLIPTQPVVVMDNLVIEARAVVNANALFPAFTNGLVGISVLSPILSPTSPSVAGAAVSSTEGARRLVCSNIDSVVRIGTIKVHLPQQQQRWITCVLPKLRAAKARIEFLARSKMAPLGSIHVASVARGPDSSSLASNPSPTRGPRWVVLKVSTSFTLPEVRLEVSVSNQTLPLPYRGKHEQVAVHDVVLQAREVHSRISFNPSRPISYPANEMSPPFLAASAPAAYGGGNSFAPDHPSQFHMGTVTNPDNSFLEDISDLGSSFLPSRDISPIQTGRYAPSSGSNGTFSRSGWDALTEPEDTLAASSGEWFLDGHIGWIRGYLVAVPLGSASPPPSPRKLAQMDYLPTSPVVETHRALERVLLIDNIRFSTRVRPLHPDEDDIPGSAAPAEGWSSSNPDFGTGHAPWEDTTEPASLPTMMTTINIDFDAIHVEYSMSRAYAIALIWARLRQVEHFIRTEWLDIKAMSDWTDIAAHSDAGYSSYMAHLGSTGPSTVSQGLSLRPMGAHAGDSGLYGKKRTDSPHFVGWSPSAPSSYGHSTGVHWRPENPHLRTPSQAPNFTDEHESRGVEPPSSARPMQVVPKPASRRSIAVAGAIVSLAIWLPLGCNEFNEEEIAEHLFQDVARKGLHRIRVLATQLSALTNKHTPAVMTGGQDDYSADEEDHPPGIPSSYEQQLLSAYDGTLTEYNAPEVPAPVSANAFPGPATWPPGYFEQELEVAVEKAWDGIRYVNLRQLIAEEALVAIDTFSIQPIVPQLLISPPSTQPAGSRPAVHPVLGRSNTYDTRGGADVRWNLSGMSPDSFKSPAAFTEALRQSMANRSGPASSPGYSAENSPMNGPDEPDDSDMPDPSESSGQPDMMDHPHPEPLVVAKLGLAVDAKQLHFCLPHDYDISFVIDNVNNLVKSSRNLLHFTQHELVSALSRSRFDAVTANPAFSNTCSALVFITNQLQAPWMGNNSMSLPPSPMAPGGLNAFASNRYRHESADGQLGVHSSSNPAFAGVRRRVQSLHTLSMTTPEITEKSWHLSWPKPVVQPVRLPYLTLNVQMTSFVVDDDPFETALGRIYRYGLSEQQARLVREAAFEKTAEKLKAATDKDVELPRARADGGRFSSGHDTGNVDIDAAWDRLERYNASNWIRIIRSGMVYPRDPPLPVSAVRPTHPNAASSPSSITQNRLANLAPPGGSTGNQSAGSSAPSSRGRNHNIAGPKDPLANPLLRPRIQPYHPASWTHPVVPLTKLDIRNLGVTIAPPPHIRNMQDAAIFIRHTDGCTPLTYLYDILVPIRLHLRMGDTRMNLRNYPLPLFHIPDINELVSVISTGGQGTHSPGGGVAGASRRQLVSILNNNKRSNVATHGRMQKERYLKERFGGISIDHSRGHGDSDGGMPSPTFSGAAHPIHSSRLGYGRTRHQQARVRRRSSRVGIGRHLGFDPQGPKDDDPSQPGDRGCAWEVKGDLVVAEALSGEESVRVIWVPVILEGLSLVPGRPLAYGPTLLDNCPHPRRSEPNVGYIRVHRTVPPPKFFAKLNIRIHTAPKLNTLEGMDQHSPRLSGSTRSSFSGSSDGMRNSLSRPPVQLIWDQSIQPCITTFSQRLENLTSASVDPSPSLAWWDKLRMLLHGSVRLKFIENLDPVIYSSSQPDPTTPEIPSGRSPKSVTGRSSRSARTFTAKATLPSPPLARKGIPNPYAGPGEFWFLMRGSRDPYNTIGENIGFLTMWRGGIQIHIGQSKQPNHQPGLSAAVAGGLTDDRQHTACPNLSTAVYDADPYNSTSDRVGGTSEMLPRAAEQSQPEPRRSRSFSTLINNHDMIVHDIIQIISNEFIFSVPILNNSSELKDTISSSDSSSHRSPSISESSSGPNPRVRFSFLPSYKLTKKQQQARGSGESDGGIPGSAIINGLVGYAETIHKSPILRFEKQLLHLTEGVKFTLGLGFGVNLDVLSNLDTYAQWLFSPTPWLSSQLRTQGGILLHDPAHGLEDIPTAAEIGAQLAANSGVPRLLGPRAPTRPSRTARRTHSVRHYEIIMRVPKFAKPPFGQREYDSYLGFRSDHVHMSMGLRCPFTEEGGEAASTNAATGLPSAYQSAVPVSGTKIPPATAERVKSTPPSTVAPFPTKNFIGLSTNTINRIMAFTPLFASKMLLPIRRGALFPDVSTKDMKFGKFLKSVKCRLDVKGLDLSFCQNLEGPDPNLSAFLDAIDSKSVGLLEDSLLVSGQTMEIKAKVAAMDLNLLAIQQSRTLTVDSVKGIIYPEEGQSDGQGYYDSEASDRRSFSDGLGTSLGSKKGSLHRSNSTGSIGRPGSRQSNHTDGTDDSSAQQHQITARQWVIDDCNFEVDKIDIRMAMSDYHLFSHSLLANTTIPTEPHGAMRILAKERETLKSSDLQFISLDHAQDLSETSLEEAIFSNLKVEPLVYSPRMVYFKQTHRKRDDDPNYNSIPLYQNMDLRNNTFQNNAANLRDSRTIQISLLQTRLRKVKEEIDIQIELQQEMEDLMLNADQAQELMAQQTLERARFNIAELQTKRKVIERTIHKLQNSQGSAQLARGSSDLETFNRLGTTAPGFMSPQLGQGGGGGGGDQGLESNETSEDSFAATFKHRFLVHSAYGIWNTQVRDILLKFLYVEETARAFQYFMSMAATKVVRDLCADDEPKADQGDTRSGEEFSDFDSVGSPNGTARSLRDSDGFAIDWEAPHSPPSSIRHGPSNLRDTASVAPSSHTRATSTASQTAGNSGRHRRNESTISQSRFLQLVKPRRPRRQDVLLNRATTEDYIQYLLQSGKDAEPEVRSHDLDDLQGDRNSRARRARRRLSKFTHHLLRGPDIEDPTHPSGQSGPHPHAHSEHPYPSEYDAYGMGGDPGNWQQPEGDFGLLDDLKEYFIVNSIYVEFLNPQVNAALNYESDDAVILAAERIQLKTLSLFDEETAEKDVTNPQDDNEHLVKSRLLFGFENFQVFAVQKKNFRNKPLFFADCNYGAKNRYLWPMWVPMEVLLDERDVILSILEPLVEKTSGLLIYDKANTVRIQANYSDLSLDDRANFIGLHFPSLSIKADSRQYATIFSIINDLLVYSVPIKKKHSDQIHTLTLAADMTDFTGALANVQFMQASIRKRKELIRNQIIPTSSFAPLNDVRGFRGNQKEYMALRDKLRLTMEVITNAQKQKLSRQQQQEAQGQRVVSRRTSLRIDHILLSMRVDSDHPLCDCNIEKLTLMATSHSDQSIAYSLDINQAIITNQLPDPFFYEVLSPFTEELAGPVDFSRQKMICLRWSSLAPVGGISVVEHFELDLFPLRLQVTHEFGKKVMRYFFPEKEKGGSSGQSGGKGGGGPSTSGGGGGGKDGSGSISSPSTDARTAAERETASSYRSHTQNRSTAGSITSRPRSVHTTASGNSTGRRSQSGKPLSIHSSNTVPDDKSVLEMKSRASKNKTFVYLKLPGARHCLSYQGPKGKNLEDLHGFVFTLPTFEYHNETWSWLELVTQIRKDVIRVALAHTGSLVREKIRQIRAPRHHLTSYAESVFDRPGTPTPQAGDVSRRPDQRSVSRTGTTATSTANTFFDRFTVGKSPQGKSTTVGLDEERRRARSLHSGQHPHTDGEITGPEEEALGDGDSGSVGKPKNRLVNPLTAMSNFARKLSKNHPSQPPVYTDFNGREFDTYSVSDQGQDDTVMVDHPGYAAESSSVTASVSAGRPSLSSRSSGKGRFGGLLDPSTRELTSAQRKKKEEEKARLLFGSHYPTGKK
ncbi:Protein SABRE [Dimargaris cristalligena]|nr:Protein SABRE [Dimargaris cristalligena]